MMVRVVEEEEEAEVEDEDNDIVTITADQAEKLLRRWIKKELQVTRNGIIVIVFIGVSNTTIKINYFRLKNWMMISASSKWVCNRTNSFTCETSFEPFSPPFLL